jgi:nucleotide-binding universal stress UspA family protein
MGTHGRTGLQHLVLGSVAEAVVRTASCPVVTIPSKTRRATHAANL